MNDTARIEAAIVKLETLRAASQGEHWYRSIGGISAYGGEFGANPEGIVHVRDGERSAYTPQITSADADLIVTLHRSIDAQLEILRNGVTWPSAHVTPRGKSLYLALADAILDGDS